MFSTSLRDLRQLLVMIPDSRSTPNIRRISVERPGEPELDAGGWWLVGGEGISISMILAPFSLE